MNTKQSKVLKAIFEHPQRADILWSDVESLLTALGAQITEGNGSRKRLLLNGIRAILHKPHPRPTLSKACVKSLKDFLEEANCKP